MKRSSGILLHISSLPSPYGIGTLGKEAYEFVDFLSGAKQSYWQVLPVTPTSFGDSPYQSSSTFAGNPYFIDLDRLIEEGLLLGEEVQADWGDRPDRVDYGKIYQNRYRVLHSAFNRFDRSLMEHFCRDNAAWLDDYALFEACKNHFGGKSWIEWDEDIRFRRSEALERYRNELNQEIDFFKFLQYEFDLQWKQLKAYANRKGVSLIGDIPIYVPWDSVEVWTEPRLFQLDEQLIPTRVAGVPPDYFSPTGQLWGNPLYDWDEHKKDGYAWWCRRLGAMKKRFSVVRIDHFRGLESYWAVPFGETTAINGQWEKGPNMDLISAIKREQSELSIIAEDLGFLTPEVKNMLSASGFPGMRVLQFGFEPYQNSRDLPHNYPPNSVAYTGTHDNNTMMGWVKEADAASLGFAVQYLGLNTREGFPLGFARGLLNSAAQLAIIPIQDYLGLGAEGRMNTPGTTGWWTYRMNSTDLTPALQKNIANYTLMSGR